MILPALTIGFASATTIGFASAIREHPPKIIYPKSQEYEIIKMLFFLYFILYMPDHQKFSNRLYNYLRN